MSLTFGVTVLPDPPYRRFVELLQLAEQHGFEYGWTYDSHVLWQDSFPTLALAAQAAERMRLRHHGTQPRHARPHRRRERLRDPPGHLRGPHDHGHRPWRLGAARDRPEAR